MNRRGFFGRLSAGLGGAVLAKHFSADPSGAPVGVPTWTFGPAQNTTFTMTTSPSVRITDEFGNTVSGMVTTWRTT